MTDEEVDLKVKFNEEVKELYDIPVGISNESLIGQCVLQFFPKFELKLQDRKVLSLIQPKFNLKKYRKKTGNKDDTIRAVLIMDDKFENLGKKEEDEEEKKKLTEYEEKVKALERDFEVLQKGRTKDKKVISQLEQENRTLKSEKEFALNELERVKKELEVLRKKVPKRIKSDVQYWNNGKKAASLNVKSSDWKSMFGPGLEIRRVEISVKVKEILEYAPKDNFYILIVGVVPKNIDQSDSKFGSSSSSSGWGIGLDQDSGRMWSCAKGKKSKDPNTGHRRNQVISTVVDFKKGEVAISIDGEFQGCVRGLDFLKSGDGVKPFFAVYKAKVTMELLSIVYLE